MDFKRFIVYFLTFIFCVIHSVAIVLLENFQLDIKNGIRRFIDKLSRCNMGNWMEGGGVFNLNKVHHLRPGAIITNNSFRRYQIH